MMRLQKLSWVSVAAFACVLHVSLPTGWAQTVTRLSDLDSVNSGHPQPAPTVPVVFQDEPPIPAPEFDPRQPPPAPRAETRQVVEDVAEEPWTLFRQDNAFKVHGWIAGGITGNARNTTGRFNGPLSFNDRRDEPMLNQLYTVIERPLDTENGWDIGGRADLLFGTDYIFTQAAGLETRRDFSPKWNNRRFYGLAMPQMYLEAGYGDLSVKLGHFYTILGYEVVTAPDNFFYSHAITMQYAEPFTQTGGLGTWNANDNWTFSAGLVDGWDKFDPLSSRAQFLGGASYTPDHEQYSIVCAVITGDEDGSELPVIGNRTLYTIVFSLNVTENLQYVIEHDHGIQSGVEDGTWEWYGVNQYLFYTLNDRWKAGVRGEWFRDDDGVRVAAVRESNLTSPGGYRGNFFEMTAGLNWLPTSNLTLRPEVRWDWFDGQGEPFDGRQSMFTFGVDAVLIW
jgi:hypothetical protein